MEVLLLGLQVAGQSDGERRWYVGMEHTADEDGKGTCVVEQVFGQQRQTLVGVAAHLPDGICLVGGHVVLSQQRFDLRIEVTEAVACIFQPFGTDENECLMHEFVGCGTALLGEQRLDALEKLTGKLCGGSGGVDSVFGREHKRIGWMGLAWRQERDSPLVVSISERSKESLSPSRSVAA